jgi:hypothetical protein
VEDIPLRQFDLKDSERLEWGVGEGIGDIGDRDTGLIQNVRVPLFPKASLWMYFSSLCRWGRVVGVLSLG